MEPSPPGVLPYATPATDPLKLFSMAGILIATFVGSPVAGTILLAMNYRRMGKANLFWPTLVWGVLAMIGVGVILAFLPERMPGTVINIILLFIMRAIAKHLQGGDLTVHQARGGAFVSNWIALGISLICLLAVLIIVVVVVVLLAWFGWIDV